MHQEYQQYTNNNIVRYINAILTCRSLQEVHNNFRQSISHQLLLLFHIVWLAEIEPTYMQMHQEWIHQWHINIVVIFYLKKCRTNSNRAASVLVVLIHIVWLSIINKTSMHQIGGRSGCSSDYILVVLLSFTLWCNLYMQKFARNAQQILT
jgi:hypothetical protein